MNLLELIKNAGIVGCGGAGFPTHVKLNCTVKYLIINGAECEPLLRTDRWLMKNKSDAIITAAQLIAEQIKAQHTFIALKETYNEEITTLQSAIDRVQSFVRLFPLKNFYPAGDEQIMVCEVTGQTVPPSGIPLDVGTVVSNIATVYEIYRAAQKKTFTHKYLTVTGAVSHPTILNVPIGTSFQECLDATDGALLSDYHIVAGGPMMGKVYTKEQAASLSVTKTTSGILVIPDDTALVRKKEVPLSAILRRAKTTCIQCSYCTEQCPRYLTGHPLKPHKIMRKLAYAADAKDILSDPDVKQAMICSECGVCETYACPMGLQPRQVNIYLKNELRRAGLRYIKPEGPFHKLPERSYRRSPSRRMAARLDVGQYYDYSIEQCLALHPSTVHIPLRQHIGALSVPVVQTGDTVSIGQLIAAIPKDALGANIHASIDGIVQSINDTEIEICAVHSS